MRYEKLVQMTNGKVHDSSANSEAPSRNIIQENIISINKDNINTLYATVYHLKSFSKIFKINNLKSEDVISFINN